MKLPIGILFVPGLLALGLLSVLPSRGASPMTGDEVMKRAAERAESPQIKAGRPEYIYQKHTVTDQLDSKGQLKDRQDKHYDVLVSAGLSQLRLTQLNGKELSPSQRKKQDEREAAERQQITDGKPGSKGDERENFLTADLVAKYNCTLVGEKVIEGRPAYEITFKPKTPAQPIHKMTDRFLNQAAGTVWIDREEYEIARAEVHLQGEVTLWGGLVGTLNKCNYTLERTRMPDGAWFNRYSHGYFEGRKLLEPMLIRTFSQSTGFQRRELALN